MSPEEMRAMPMEALDEAVESARQELFNLRFQKVTGRLSDTSRPRQVRRQLARLLTVRRERELWAEYEAATGGAEGSETEPTA